MGATNNVHFVSWMFYLSVGGAFVAFLMFVSNPYKTRWRARRVVNSFIPQSVQDDLKQLTRNWGTTIRISHSQLRLLSIIGALLGALGGVLLIRLMGTGMGVLIGGVLVLVGYVYPQQRYKHGFSRAMLSQLESEAALLAGIIYQARGIAGMSVQISMERFAQSYPDTQTAQLINGIPVGVSYTDALLGLNLPAEDVGNWLEVVTTISTVNEMGDPTETLRTLRDRVQARQVQQLKTLIKKKAFTAPAATVILILPGLMAILLGAIILQAVRALSGSSILP